MYESLKDMIAQHQGLVITIARRIHRTLPPTIPFEDVQAYGQLGLAQAARSYVPVEGAEFATYAYYRVSGAIYDGLASMNWLSRAEFRRRRAAQDYLEEQKRVSTTAGPEELAAEFAERTEGLSTIHHFSALPDESEQLSAREAPPHEQAEQGELSEMLRTALSTLNRVERELIEYTYFDNLSLAEASARLGHSRSWGSRVHARIIRKLGLEMCPAVE